MCGRVGQGRGGVYMGVCVILCVGRRCLYGGMYGGVCRGGCGCMWGMYRDVCREGCGCMGVCVGEGKGYVWGCG